MQIKLPEVQGTGGGEYQLSGGNDNLKLLDKPLVVELHTGQRLNTHNVFRYQGDQIRLRLLTNTNEETKPQLLYIWIAALLLLPKPKKVKLGSVEDYRMKCIEFDTIETDDSQIVVKLVNIEISTLDGNTVMDVSQRMLKVLDFISNKTEDTSFSSEFGEYSNALGSSDMYGSNGILNIAEVIRRKYSKAYPNFLSVSGDHIQTADEVPKRFLRKLVEGAKKTVIVNAYERNGKAREICIEHYGTKCSVCDFDFESKYGEIGLGYIHVHHLTKLSSIGRRYELDPIRDLRPVCPNCHSMLHKRDDPFSIEELRKMLKG